MMSTSGVISRVTIGVPIDEVWSYITTKYNWGNWWGSGIRTLDPGWEKSAKLQFAGSYQPIITIDEINANEAIHFSMPYLRLTIRVKEAGNGTTEVEIESEPDGASWPDGGKNQQRIMQEKLARLKSALE